MSQILIEKNWKNKLQGELEKPYMETLKDFLSTEIKNQKKIYPKDTDYFKALNLTHFDNIKVVIVGQDPYHGEGQAHGLSFSVPQGTTTPRSLSNIYKELKSDLKVPISSHGCLEEWAKQGVLLLNTTLTVEAGKAGSHRGKGWEEFTDQIIRILNEEKKNLVFILWGKDAQDKGSIIDSKKHCVLTSSHPSPFSAHRGFFGSQPFSKTNSYLKSQSLSPIDWSAHLKTQQRN